MITPVPADYMLDGMRASLEADGEGLAMIMMGLAEDGVMVPVLDISPRQMLVILASGVEQGEIPPVHWLAFVADTYRFTDNTQPEELVDFGALFEAGDPRVEECLMTFCVAHDGPTYTVFQPYVRTEDGIEWGELENTGDRKEFGPLFDAAWAVLDAHVGAPR